MALAGHPRSDTARPHLDQRGRVGLLILYMLVGACSSTDRAIITVVIEPIKHEFNLSDSQLGVLAGLAFSIAHATIAIPAGAIADRVSRRKLIAGALVAWSLLTALAGLAQNYVSLVLSRMGVGAGEACGQPATLSSVADLFPPERRATALSVYYLCTPISLLLAGAGGGLITAAFGWRAAMVAVAAPGFVVSLALLFSRDIPRAIPEHQAPDSGHAPSLLEVFRFILSQRSLLHLIVAMALVNVVIAGIGAFGFAFFMRYHHMSLRSLGPLYGVASAAITLVVILGSGLVADRLAARSPKYRLWVIAAALVLATPIVMAGFVLPQPVSFICFLFHLLIIGAWLGPAHATAQNLARPRMRSTVAGIMFVTGGFVGVGLGPVLTGAISDAWMRSTGADGLQVALILTTAVGFWSALHFHLATRSLERDLARV
jgi:MFS family permease